MESLIQSAYLVPGLPHILLASDQNSGWASLKKSYQSLADEIAASDADLILYFSSQWLSVLGYMFQGDPEPQWEHVDPNWYEFGSMPYHFKVDTDFAESYATEVGGLGHNTKVVNYHGFPIDTGTIVAQKLLNPHNQKRAAMVSCNIYAEKSETIQIGQAAARALSKSGKKAIAVLVSNLSNRFELSEIEPSHDKISSQKDDEWNRKILELLSQGRLEDVSQTARTFASQANADMGFRGIWWLSGLCGLSNHFRGKVFDYQPVWGTGAALVGLYPTKSIASVPIEESYRESEGSQAQIVSAMTEPGAATLRGRAEKPEPTPKALSPDTATTTSDRVMSGAAPEPVGAYPHARRYQDLIFLSGIGPRKRGAKTIPGVTQDREGTVTAYDIEVQTHSVIDNLELILESAGSSLENILDVQVYLTNMKADFAKFNQVYKERLGTYGATRTTVEVGAMPTPIAVEFKVIARPRPSYPEGNL